MIEGRCRPVFFFSLQFFTFCLTYYQPYESMTGPVGQRVLSYLLSRVTSQKPCCPTHSPFYVQKRVKTPEKAGNVREGVMGNRVFDLKQDRG